MVLNSLFKLYAAYALARNLIDDSQNHFTEMDNSILHTCINLGLAESLILTRNEVLLMTERLQNPSDAFIVLASFEGIGGRASIEFYDLTMDNFDGNLVKLNSGREFEISDNLLKLANESANEYNYHRYREDGTTDDRPFSPGDARIIKAAWNIHQDGETAQRFGRNMRARMARISEYLGSKGIMFNALGESGRLNAINEMVRNGTQVYDAIKNKDLQIRYGEVKSVLQYLLKYRRFINE